MALTNNARFSHCLPLRRNIKATDAVMDADYCVALDEAELRTVCASIGWQDVATYTQSGNIVFAAEGNLSNLEKQRIVLKIANMLV